MTTAVVHRPSTRLLTQPVRVMIAGLGGSGSSFLAGMPYLHQALIARGHPHGFDVLGVDGDEVTLTNTVRQPFSVSDVGLNKASVLVSRINAFWGLDWKAHPYYLRPDSDFGGLGPDVVVGCVDSIAARKVIAAYCAKHFVAYWLDMGNSADLGQWVIGQPLNSLNKDVPDRLPTHAELHWRAFKAKERRGEPSCSAAEAITRQAPFVNPLLANFSLSLLDRLFASGITHQGGYLRITPEAESTRLVSSLPITDVVPSHRKLTTKDLSRWAEEEGWC